MSFHVFSCILVPLGLDWGGVSEFAYPGAGSVGLLCRPLLRAAGLVQWAQWPGPTLHAT